MVKKICKQFCESGTTKLQGQAGGSTHLQPDDIELLRFLKTSRASMPTGELYKHVNDFCIMLLVGHPSLRYIEHCKRTWTVENVLGRNLHTLSRRNLALKTWITAKNLWITFTHCAFNSENINIQLITVVVHCWHPLYTISLFKWRQIM
mgnify:CR=1 FL=1